MRGIGKLLNAEGCIERSCMVSGANWMLLGIEWEGRYWWAREIGKQLTVGECIVGSCMERGPDLMLLGERMVIVILVCERNWEIFDCRRVHSGELHGEWC